MVLVPSVQLNVASAGSGVVLSASAGVVEKLSAIFDAFSSGSAMDAPWSAVRML